MTGLDLDDFEPAAPESFEMAKPVKANRAAPAQKQMPASEEAESYVIACCLLDEGASLDRASTALTPVSFYWPLHSTIFAALTNLRQQSKSIGLETLGVELAKEPTLFKEIGGWGRLMQFKADTTAHAGTMIAQVAELARRRHLIQSSARIQELAYAGTGAEELEALAAQDFRAPTSRLSPKPRPISSFAYPHEDDPNTILGSDDYLGRGGGLLFISHAGAGKSSWIMDACMMWALGQAWMGIKCGGVPRKSLIIQAEDSDRYIGKIFASFAHVNKLTPEQTDLLAKNCLIVRLKGVSGPAFFAELKSLAQKHQPDLVVINPIYLYAEGDITRSEFAQPFLVGLDEANKDEKFAYLLIHHTGKPAAKGKDGKRPELEDWESAYMGFGSSYLANWPRCTALLEPVAGHMGKYQIKLGKGGLNAGVTKEVPQGAGTRTEPSTRISIKHSTERMPVNGKDKPVYYWEIDTDAPKLAEANKGGKEKVFHFEMFTSFIPRAEAQAMSVAALYRYAQDKQDIGETTFKQLIRDAVRDGEIEQVKKGVGFAYYLKIPGS